MFSSGAMLSVQQNRKLVRKRHTFLNKADKLSYSNDSKKRGNDSIERAWKARRYDLMKRKATIKAVGLLLTAMALLLLVGYFLVRIVF